MLFKSLNHKHVSPKFNNMIWISETHRLNRVSVENVLSHAAPHPPPFSHYSQGSYSECLIELYWAICNTNTCLHMSHERWFMVCLLIALWQTSSYIWYYLEIRGYFYIISILILYMDQYVYNKLKEMLLLNQRHFISKCKWKAPFLFRKPAKRNGSI